MPQKTAGDVWVFGYGSLMWRPAFPYVESRPAMVYGYHRALCVWSMHHRGTRETPGLVLGLDRGGSCRGVAFRVAAAAWPGALIYLNNRELKSAPGAEEGDVYEPRFVCARFDDGARIRAFVYAVNRGHSQYAGRMAVDETARIVAHSHGKSGANIDYVRNTVAHMDDLGIPDGPLHRVVRRVGTG